MTTTADIVTRALQKMGTRTTVSAAELANNTSNEAIQANISLTDVRDSLLRMAPWDFALAPINLTLLVAAPGTPENPSAPTSQWQPGQPLFPWLYEYAYPADCLRACWLRNTSTGTVGTPISPVTTYAGPSIQERIPFKVMNDPFAVGGSATVVVTNLQNALLYYIRQITNPDEMDNLFQSAWVTALGAALTMALTGDKKLANMLVQETNALIEQARVADGNEGTTTIDTTPDWIAVRGYGSPRPGYQPGFDWGPVLPLYW